jgi:probable addiction module antidote protein
MRHSSIVLGDVAGAKDARLGRDSLYKALSPNEKPRFDTAMKVARALGVKFAAQVA